MLSKNRKNLDLVIKTLINNRYPLNLIFNTINRRFASLFHRFNTKSVINNNLNNSTSLPLQKVFFTVSYVGAVSEQFSTIINRTNTKIAFTCTNKLSDLVRVHKLPKGNNTNVIYRLSCINCAATHVGQTSRKLSTYTMEHKRIPRNLSSNMTPV